MGVIAVTGATGQVGRRVAERLAGTRDDAQPVVQRLLVRDPRAMASAAGREVVGVQGYADTEGMRAALEGVDDLFLVSGRESADRVAEHRAAIDAAVAAGVRRVVYLSFLGAAPDATFTFARDHWATEQHLAASGLRWTALRDSLYHAAWPAFVGADLSLRGPAGDGRVASVGHGDVSDVVVGVLLAGDAYDGQVLDVTGPTALTVAEVADTLGRVTGRPVTYVPESLDEAYASRAGYGAPDWEVAGWVTSYAAIAAGELDVVSGTVERVMGRPPQDLETWLRAHPETWRHLVRR